MFISRRSSRNDLNRRECHELFSKINTCHLALSLQYCLGAEISLPDIGRSIGARGTSVFEFSEARVIMKL